MEYQDYLELRRRAEKRLTVISIWPLLAFCIAPAMPFFFRRRTTARR